MHELTTLSITFRSNSAYTDDLLNDETRLADVKAANDAATMIEAYAKKIIADLHATRPEMFAAIETE